MILWRFLVDLLPEAGSLCYGQLLEVLRRRLLDEESDLFARHGDLIHEVVHSLDGHAAHLYDNVAEVEEADAIDEAAFDDARDDEALALYLDGEAERFAWAAGNTDPVDFILVDTLLFDNGGHTVQTGRGGGGRTPPVVLLL
jgi:hypothetical protein